MDENNELRKLQNEELKILENFIKICEMNNLKYYVVGGTLIGAVRHQGFIPWDDDMDIAMPREDYEKFLNEYYKQLPDYIKVNHYKFSENAYFYPLKLTNTNVKVLEQRLEDCGQYSYLSIDVFPIDCFPNGKISQLKYKLTFYYYKMLIGFCNVDILRNNVKRSFLEKIMIRFAKITKIGKKIKLVKVQEKLDKFLKKYKLEDCDFIGDITGAYGFREFVPKEYFGDGKKMIFENIEVNCPTEADKYLTQIYGNYMELPPVEKRQSSHIKIVE